MPFESVLAERRIPPWSGRAGAPKALGDLMSTVVAEVLEHAPEWTDASGVSSYLGDAVPASTLLALARSGRLPSVKIGARRIFHVPTVREVLQDAMARGRSV